MFLQYNNFGSMFQETAHYIGLLIKKNMVLNRDLGEQVRLAESLEEKLRLSEEAYENMIKSATDKERVIEDLQSENEGLKLQLQQILTQPMRL
jgi:hypothetical protein